MMEVDQILWPVEQDHVRAFEKVDPDTVFPRRKDQIVGPRLTLVRMFQENLVMLVLDIELQWVAGDG